MIYHAPSYDVAGTCIEVSNDLEIAHLIAGDCYECESCHGSAEVEGSHGPKPCYPCVAGWPLIIDHSGTMRMVQYGDLLERHEDGLHWTEGSASFRCQDCDFAAIGPRSQADDMMYTHTSAMKHRRRDRSGRRS